MYFLQFYVLISFCFSIVCPFDSFWYNILHLFDLNQHFLYSDSDSDLNMDIVVEFQYCKIVTITAKLLAIFKDCQENTHHDIFVAPLCARCGAALFTRRNDSVVILSGTEISAICLSPAVVLWEPETPPHYHQLHNNEDRVYSLATTAKSPDSLHTSLVLILFRIFITEHKSASIN